MHSHPQLKQVRIHALLLLAVLVTCVATASGAAAPTARQLAREAVAAQQAGQLEVALAKLEAARALRPDYPRAILLLARAYAAAGRTDDAITQLEHIAGFSLAFDPAKDPALSPLARHAAWPALLERFDAAAKPRGRGEVAFHLPARDGIIESIAIDAEHRWFFGDVRNRCIWVRTADGALREFSSPRDGLLGVFGLAIDEARGVLWAGVSATPEMKDFDPNGKNSAWLAEYDLATGALRRAVPVPDSTRAHILGSLCLAADGSVYATDSASPVIWRLAPGGSQLEAWLEHEDFVSLQGLAFSDGGNVLHVADYANGIWRIDTATRTHRLLPPPPQGTLFGIDDLRATDEGELLAVQNGVVPQRIIRISLDNAGEPARWAVLESGHPAMNDISTGCFRDGTYRFAGNAGWALFESASVAPAPRDVTIFAVKL